MMELLPSLALGICLSAACGFRVFVPLLVMSVAGVAGMFTPAEEIAWIATWPALVAFGAATIAEIVAYYVPWADNALDTIASPAALVAGALATASVLGEFSPMVQWILAIVAGAGTAGAVQAGTVLARGTSTATTAGLGNFAVASVENVLSIATSVLALFIPVVVIVLLVVLAVVAWRIVRRYRRRAAPGVR
jgi:hypothetical protein